MLRAYSLLVGEVEPGEEKGYKPLLYLGLKCCPAEKHIHVQCNTDLISLLIARAEPELVGGSRRERHAKTMEVAQEEVVTCVGICLLERLQRLAQRLREEEQMVDMLQFATLQAMRRSFEMAVESKRGVSQLELLCEELSREEAVQKQRKEAKKQRRKKRRNKTKESANGLVDENGCQEDGDDDEEDPVAAEEEPVLFTPAPLPVVTSCHCSDHESSGKKSKASKGKAQRASNNNDVERKGSAMNGKSRDGEWGSSRSPSPVASHHLPSAKQHSSNTNRKAVQSPQMQPLQAPANVSGSARKCPQESGYCSTNSSNLTTPEGSDVACNEGLCNHHSGFYSHYQMITFKENLN